MSRRSVSSGLTLASLATLVVCGCDGRAVEDLEIDLSTVKTGIYSARLLELSSTCESRGEKATVKLDERNPIWVHGLNGAYAISIGLIQPGFGKSRGPNTLAYLMEGGDSFVRTPSRPWCGATDDGEFSLLHAVGGRITILYSEQWHDGTQPGPGCPDHPCDTSAELEYTLVRACEAPCQLEPQPVIEVDGLSVQPWDCTCP